MSNRKTRKEWNREVADSVRNSEIVSLETDDNLLESSSSLFIEAPFFDSDYIFGTLSEDKRDSTELNIVNNRSEEGSYTFQIRRSNYSFSSEVAGTDVIKRVLQDEQIGHLNGVESFDVSQKGVALISSEFEQPRLFNNISMSEWRLYKTVRLNDGRYKFVFRQMREKPEEEVIDNLSTQRVRKVIWDTYLDCVDCSEYDSVVYAPSCKNDLNEFTFQCNECESEWRVNRDLEEKIPPNQTRSFIEFKLKQYYQTAVGSP